MFPETGKARTARFDFSPFSSSLLVAFMRIVTIAPQQIRA